MKEKEIYHQIMILKAKLRESDYRLLKKIDGEYTDEEYEPYKKQRQEWREKINELEKQL